MYLILWAKPKEALVQEIVTFLNVVVEREKRQEVTNGKSCN